MNKGLKVEKSLQNILFCDFMRVSAFITCTENRYIISVESLTPKFVVLFPAPLRWAYYIFKIPVKVEPVQMILTPEEVILEYVKTHGYIKRAECQKLLNVNEIQSRYILQKMKNKGLLKLEGIRKGARYILS